MALLRKALMAVLDGSGRRPLFFAGPANIVLLSELCSVGLFAPTVGLPRMISPAICGNRPFICGAQSDRSAEGDGPEIGKEMLRDPLCSYNDVEEATNAPHGEDCS
jgi:hypothetical protein